MQVGNIRRAIFTLFLGNLEPVKGIFSFLELVFWSYLIELLLKITSFRSHINVARFWVVSDIIYKIMSYVNWQDKVTKDLPMPPLFQFLILLGLKIFVSEKVELYVTYHKVNFNLLFIERAYWGSHCHRLMLQLLKLVLEGNMIQRMW